MTVTSFWFFILLTVGVLIYYIVPKRGQWAVLIGLSIAYYLFAAVPYTIIFPFLSTIIAYCSTMLMEKQFCKGRGGYNKIISSFAVIAVCLNVLIWFLLKGSSFWTGGTAILNRVIKTFPVLHELPFAGAMGMGYYTAQVIGYILDVSWQNIEPQRNPFKLFLFVSFFPQLTVGPISRYKDMKTLYEAHPFLYHNICFGCQRIIWGLFKKLVISDRIGIIVKGIWANTDSYNGLWLWIAVFLYPVQIYTDFSGCMDIVLGAAELFDIHLAENFKNPFFSRNSQEFWQRWHITLGIWARDYIYYPVLKSKFLVQLGKKAKKKFGKRIGKFIPWSIGMAILWFIMGFWHGSVQHIFGVSLWFCSILILSELTSPLCNKLITALEVKTRSFSWHLFQSVRTYFVYAVGAVFFSASGLSGAIEHFKQLLTSCKNVNPWIFFDNSILGLGVEWRDINLIIIGIVALILVANLREKYGYARAWMEEQSVGFRWLVWILLFVFVLIYGLYGPGYDASSFIYQGF